MREGEVLNLRWQGLSLKDRVIRLEAHETKGAEAREIQISHGLYEILSGLPRGIQPELNVLPKRGSRSPIFEPA
jgi:integrase